MNKWTDNTNMYVSTLTSDEVVYAGAAYDKTNLAYYLVNDYFANKYTNTWFMLSPTHYLGDGVYFEYVYGIAKTGVLHSADNDEGLFRPSTVLNSNLKISDGDGTKANPYEVN